MKRATASVVVVVFLASAFADHMWGRNAARENPADLNGRRGFVRAVLDETTLEIEFPGEAGRLIRVALCGVVCPAEGDRGLSPELDPSAAAVAFLETRALDQAVRLFVDERYPSVDAERRARAYMWLVDRPDEMINESMVREGFAEADKAMHVYRLRFQSHEKRARREGRGIWAAGR